jgi:hypothetical protein
MSIYLCICENCKKDVQSEEHLKLVLREDWGKTRYGLGIQKFICQECIDKFSKKDIISDD